MTSPNNGHGLVGTREQKFVRLLPENPKPFSDASLDALAALMIVVDTELNDGADAEENLAVPAGYTYFGQFIDHDLTLDTTSSFAAPTAAASNLRTPALDLDCVYGSGPQDQPYMYEADGATLLIDPGAKDLRRQDANGRAIIGDKRNDENSIVCQIQLAMIKFHNAVVAKLKASGDTSNLFERARAEVTWTYQRVVLEDFLHRVVNTHTYDFFTQRHAALGLSLIHISHDAPLYSSAQVHLVADAECWLARIDDESGLRAAILGRHSGSRSPARGLLLS